MATLGEEAMAYEQKRVGNIAELENVNINAEVGEEKEVEFPYKYIEIDGQRYRVPNSVLQSLKVLRADNPNLTTFKVKKTGEGMNTEYTVIPVI